MTTLTAKPLTAKPLTARPLTAYGLGESTDGANQLVWHALAANSSGVITDQLKGFGTPTWAHTSSLLLPDYQGVYRTIGAGEAPIVGARWVGGVPYATDELGDPLTDWWFQCQPSYTNSATYSNDLTNAVWTKTTASAALDAIGITGAPNTATTLTDASGVVIGNATRTIAGLSGAAFTADIMVLKEDDETSFPDFDIGGKSFRFNKKTGDYALRGGTPTVEVEDLGTWWRIYVSDTAAGGAIYCSPAVTAVWGTATQAAAQGSVVVGNYAIHIGKTIAQVRGSAPIITAASTVSTTAVYGTFDIANHSDTKGAYMASVKKVLSSAEQAANAAGGQIIAGNRLYYADSSAAHSANDGTTTVSVTDTWAADATVKVGVAYQDGGNMVAVQDGTAGTPDSYDGDWSATFTIGASANKAPILIKDVRRYNLSYTAGLAKLLEITA